MIIEKFKTRQHKNHKIKIVIDRQEVKVLLEVLKAVRLPVVVDSMKPLLMTHNIISKLNKILGIKEITTVLPVGEKFEEAWSNSLKELNETK